MIEGRSVNHIPKGQAPNFLLIMKCTEGMLPREAHRIPFVRI